MKKITLDCKTCPARRLGVLCAMPAAVADEQSRAKTTNLYKAGQIIFHEGNQPFGVHDVFSGRVKLYKTGRAGKQQIIRLAKDGDLLGYEAILAETPYAVTAEAIEDSRVCFIEKQLFLANLKKDPSTIQNILKKIAGDLGSTEDRVVSVVQKSVNQRLAEVLSFLSGKFGSAKGGPILIELSREDMAELADTTQETAMRVIGEFRKKKLIAVDGRKITLLQPEALLKTANLEY